MFGYKFLHERNGGRGSFKFLYWQGWMEKPGVYLPHTFIGINIKVSSQIVSNFHLLSSCLDRYSCVKEMEGVASKKVRPGGSWKEKPTNQWSRNMLLLLLWWDLSLAQALSVLTISLNHAPTYMPLLILLLPFTLLLPLLVP